MVLTRYYTMRFVRLQDSKKILLLVMLLLCVAARQAEPVYTMIIPAVIKQGNAYFIECAGFPPGCMLQFEFSDATKSPKFPLVKFYMKQRQYSRKKQRHALTAFVCGIHPLAASGPAILKVFDKNNAVMYTQRVAITAESWQKEDVYLNSTLTELVTKPDPQKEAQAKRYQEILATVNTSGIWLTKPFELPVSKPRITSHFGIQRRYIYSNGSKYITFHAGIDFGKEEDTTIYASGSGRVVLAENRIVTGNTVIIEHLPGVYSIYMHMDSLTVALHDNVRAGMPIGIIGSTGLATGTHLHWEIRVSTVPVNPFSLMHIDFFSKLHTILSTQEGGDLD